MKRTYVHHMENIPNPIPNMEPAVIGYLNEESEIHWKFSDRLLDFIGHLPEARHYPLIAHMEHDFGDELALLVIHHEDLRKSEWHDLKDYR